MPCLWFLLLFVICSLVIFGVDTLEFTICGSWMFILELYPQKRRTAQKVIGEKENSCSDWAFFNLTTSVLTVKLNMKHRMAFKRTCIKWCRTSHTVFSTSFMHFVPNYEAQNVACCTMQRIEHTSWKWWGGKFPLWLSSLLFLHPPYTGLSSFKHLWIYEIHIFISSVSCSIHQRNNVL